MGARREPEPAPFDAIDRVVHEPARLAIMAHLAVLDEADFVYLMNETGLTRGNLSSHMTKLEDAGYVTVSKGYAGRTPRTVLALTRAGRRALADYREAMARVIASLPE